MNNQPPNILWLCTDQQRYDTIGALGNGLVRTPNADRLVEQGAALKRVYCQSLVCAPSRASMLTGRYPRTTGCRQNGQSINGSERLVPRMLADHGYTCGLAGKLHLAACSGGRVEQRIDDGYHVFHWSHHPPPDWGEANAYTRWLHEHGQRWEDLYSGPGDGYVKEGVPTEYHQTTWCAEKTIEFIRDRKNRGPWLFSFNCFDPHHPFDPPAEYLRKYDPDKMPLPKFRAGELENKPAFQRLDARYAHNDPNEYDLTRITDDDRRRITAAYYAMCELIDDQLGRILEALEETGQAENTLVIFMSDHGEMLGDHGLYLKGPHFYEEAVRVPVVLRWPGRIQENLGVEGLVELVDLAPTLLEAAGLEIPERVQGRSLMPVLRGDADPARHRDHVYCEYYNAWTHPQAYGTMLRTEDAKIAVYHGTEDGELYDLRDDPDEFENRWHSPEHRELWERMIQRCFDASVFTMDPLPPRLGPF